MAHQILMLGGRRSGKSSILASILYSLGENMVENLCSFTDQTDYSANDGLGIPLHAKRIEIDNYLRTRQKMGANSNFLVDMTPNKGQSRYNLETQIKGASKVTFDFVDVPGEWMESTSSNYNTLKDLVGKSDVFVIAIDSPYLMQDENENINTVYNRIEEINNLLANIQIQNEEIDRKLIILCPVKCEKWTQNKQGDDVTEKVCFSYKKLINNWVNHKSVDIWIMPIETAGGIVHSKLLDGYRVFKSDKDKFGELCSINDLTNQIMLKDGKILSLQSVFSVDSEPDKSLLIDFTQLPLSWYVTNGKGFSPSLCEQPAYHILRFLVEKEKNVVRNQQWLLENEVWWRRWWRVLWSPPFGRYLKAYEDLISQMEQRHLIKTGGDGFKKIDNIIQ
jgi:hypothetical protein